MISTSYEGLSSTRRYPGLYGEVSSTTCGNNYEAAPSAKQYYDEGPLYLAACQSYTTHGYLHVSDESLSTMTDLANPPDEDIVRPNNIDTFSGQPNTGIAGSRSKGSSANPSPLSGEEMLFIAQAELEGFAYICIT